MMIRYIKTEQVCARWFLRLLKNDYQLFGQSFLIDHSTQSVQLCLLCDIILHFFPSQFYNITGPI